MDDFGLAIKDVPMRTLRAGRSSEPFKVAAKCRHNETGATWSGRWLKSEWLAGKLGAAAQIEDFAV